MNRKNYAVLALGVLLGVLLTVGHTVFAQRYDGRSDLPIAELQTLSEVFGRIKANYVTDVSDNELFVDAIRGMVNGLDPHSDYLDEDAFRELKVSTRGEFGGLGIQVEMFEGVVRVISPIDDTPAYHAGMKAGDLIIKLDDKLVKGMTLRDAVNIMRGKPGTEITLTVLREGEANPLKITIVRDVIVVKSVKSEMLENGIAYIRITQFQSHTSEDLQNTIIEMQKRNGGRLNGVILDLRNNPGGLLSSAVEISDFFIRKGRIVYTRGRIEEAKKEFNARPDDILKGTPMVVLVNEGSASASEIVSGALQDHKRAVIMGRKSFGKASVQSIYEMPDGKTAVKLTIAHYYTPKGRMIHGKGIEPDIKLEASKEPAKEIRQDSDVKAAVKYLMKK